MTKRIGAVALACAAAFGLMGTPVANAACRTICTGQFSFCGGGPDECFCVDEAINGEEATICMLGGVAG